MPIEYNHDHDNEIAVFAETNFRNTPRRFGIKTDDRRRHMYVIGKTGMGKTNLLENLVYNDIMAGHGLGIVDPHGDFAEKILDFIPSFRINDVVYVNPADVEHPISFNILETVDETHKHLIASGLMGVFKKIWPDVWSARMEYILNNTVLALLDYPGSTLLGINRMLADVAFRKRVISKIHDPVVKAFWVNEFARYNERYASEAIAPIQNKVGQFLSASVIRNIVGQVKSTINIREIMDTGKIFIMNLSKGRVGEDNSRLLGGMLITKIQLAAMERVDTPEEDRRDFYLYVDEFQNFATESFSNILSEARKYHLSLVVAHQYIEQLDELVAAAVFGNVGTLIGFRVGGADALKMVTEFTPRFTEEDLVNLPKYNVYIKLMIDGVSSDPFSATILPPLAQHHGNREKVIAVSRERYSKERSVVEDKISRWSEGLLTDNFEAPVARPITAIPSEPRVARPTPQAIAPMRGSAVTTFIGEHRSVSTPKPVGQRVKKMPEKIALPPEVLAKEYTCTRCGNSTTLTFIPDPAKPIYCKDCLKIVREEQRQGKKSASPAPQTPPAMSLSEALATPPVDFRGRAKGLPAPQSTPRLPARQKPFNSPPISPQPAQQLKPPSTQPYRPTMLRPGQSSKI